jgi:sugar lactone lactonase YvrE
VVAELVAAPTTGTVRTAYSPMVLPSIVCIQAGMSQTVTVHYTPIPTSGKVWLGNAQTTATLLGYTAASVAADGSPPAAVAANTAGSGGFTFDRDGNVWVIGGTSADPPVARYPAAQFATSRDALPDVILTSPSFGNSIPGPQVLAFDPLGNLWVAVEAEGKLIKFTPPQIANSGSPVAAIEEGGLEAPSGIAFDFDGNLWVADKGAGTVNRIDATHLNSTGSGADLKIVAETPPPVIGPLIAPRGIAFDEDGNLWVNYDGALARLTPTDLAGVGVKTLTPSILIAPDVLTLPEGIAFDEQGGLWMADVAGAFARFAPEQLRASGTVSPAVVIDSPDVGSAGWFAIYPAPAFTPLFHALP